MPAVLRQKQLPSHLLRMHSPNNISHQYPKYFPHWKSDINSLYNPDPKPINITDINTDIVYG
jgi:hypothetical protein